jgi:protein SCO1
MSHTPLARLLAVAVLACAAGVSVGQNVGSYGMGTKPPPPSPETLGKLDISEDTQKKVLGSTIPLDGTFYDHTGAAVTFRDVIGGKPTFLVPVYFKCPMLCNQTIDNLLIALRQMRAADPKMTAGDAFHVVFFSIDSFEHPLQANGRRDAFHFELDGRKRDVPGVWFLSANPSNRGETAAAAHATITQVTDAIGFKFVRMNVKKQVEVAPDKVASEIQHASAVLLLTPTGRVSSFNTQLAYDPAALAEQVKTAAGEGTGTTSSTPSLACFLGVDSPEGYYRLAMRILAWSSVPVILLAGLVVWRARSRAQAEKLAAETGKGLPG